MLSPDSWLARRVQAMATAPWFAKIAPKVVPVSDRALMKLTKGKVSFSGLAVPTLVLTTTGSRSGQPRSAPLATLPEDDGGFLVVGSNFAREKHPAWTANVLADPSATVAFRGATVPVQARLLEGAERDDAWSRMRSVWPVYDQYQERVTRELRVFRLEPI